MTWPREDAWKFRLRGIIEAKYDERETEQAVREVWAYIEALEARLSEARQTIAGLRREVEKGRE